MEWTAIVTLLALVEYQFFSFQVGFGRGKYGVEPPSMSGPPEWERLCRIHQNTLEQLIVFIPALWAFSYFVSPTIGAGIGAAFLVGRILYFLTYRVDPDKRTTGFLMGFLASMVLLIGGLIGAVMDLAG